MTTRLNERETKRMLRQMNNGMIFISRNGIKALLALVGISVMGIVAERYLAASPSSQ